MTDNFHLLKQILQQRRPEELLLLAALLIEQDMLHPALRCLESAHQQLGPVPELLQHMARLRQRCGGLTIDWLPETATPLATGAARRDAEKCNDLLLS
ncbi:Uncharacterised protein [Plesiomonas shigelloides]|uniref:hypothetical protein n=1 Tax=Plesiomonas shigelloides TaxID=703 RepID=UPI000D994F38|nr:hypothetical protein [Plesiomonas shigelloides]SPZ44055.1 Uncharacterised protein [Plesiomonas shigelloides]